MNTVRESGSALIGVVGQSPVAVHIDGVTALRPRDAQTWRVLKPFSWNSKLAGTIRKQKQQTKQVVVYSRRQDEDSNPLEMSEDLRQRADAEGLSADGAGRDQQGIFQRTSLKFTKIYICWQRK